MTVLLLFSAFVAGIPHRSPDLTVIRVGDALRFNPDPSNPFDPNAVQIWHENSNQFLGFIPAEATPVYHEAVAAGATFTTTVLSMDGKRWKEMIFQTRATFPTP